MPDVALTAAECTSLRAMEEGGAATMDEVRSWYIVLWSEGWVGSWRREEEAVFVSTCYVSLLFIVVVTHQTAIL